MGLNLDTTAHAAPLPARIRIESCQSKGLTVAKVQSMQCLTSHGGLDPHHAPKRPSAFQEVVKHDTSLVDFLHRKYALDAHSGSKIVPWASG